MSKQKPLQRFEVYVPCQYSEIHAVDATDEQDALQKVKDGHGTILGEVSNYYGTYKIFKKTEGSEL